MLLPVKIAVVEAADAVATVEVDVLVEAVDAAATVVADALAVAATAVAVDAMADAAATVVAADVTKSPPTQKKNFPDRSFANYHNKSPENPEFFGLLLFGAGPW